MHDIHIVALNMTIKVEQMTEDSDMTEQQTTAVMSEDEDHVMQYHEDSDTDGYEPGEFTFLFIFLNADANR